MIGVVTILFISSVLYIFINDSDAYRHYTGLGESISISPDDSTLAFSYYTNGNEAIYTGDIDGKDVTQVTFPAEGEDHREPRFSEDGKSMIFLSEDSNKVRSLHYKPELEDEETIQLTDKEDQVFSAALSPDGETAYYLAMPAEDFHKEPGQNKNGTDVHTIHTDGSGHEQLTDEDRLDMGQITISDDGQRLYYNGFENGIYYDIDSGMEKTDSEIAVRGEVYHTVLSPDEDYFAYTKVDDTSEQGTFIYELFLKNVSSGDSKRLTDYNSNVVSPVFFHQEDRLALLANKNWPGEPSQYEIMTFRYEDGEMIPINLELPEPDDSFQLGAFVDKMMNEATLTVLYLLMFGLSIVYCHGSSRTYWPVIISGIVTLISLIVVFIAGYINPWLGVWVMTLTMGLGVCTVILLLFAFIYQKILKIIRGA